MSLLDLKNLADAMQAMAATIAIVVGGFWAIFKFRLFSEDLPALNVRVSARAGFSTDRDSEAQFIEIFVDVENCGRVPCQIDTSKSAIEVHKLSIVKNQVTALKDYRSLKYLSIPLSEKYDLHKLNFSPGARSRISFISAVPSNNVYKVSVEIFLGEQQARKVASRLAWRLNSNQDEGLMWDDHTLIYVDSVSDRADS